jgi:hypothetical protein
VSSVPATFRFECVTFAAVHHVHAGLAQDLESTPFDEDRGVLVDPDAKDARVLRDGAEQACDPAPLREVLVDDEAGDEGEAGRHADHVADAQRAVRAAIHDHRLAHHRGARRRAGHDAAVRDYFLDALEDGRVTDAARETQLVATPQVSHPCNRVQRSVPSPVIPRP